MIGDILVNRFRLEERLGGGAQGEIYRARDLELSRSVAIKIPNEKVDDNFVISFKREAKLLVKFEHANVVTLHDYYDPPDGMPFLVMEYLQGQPLDVRLKDQERPLTRKQLRNFAEQICGALQKAHEAGLVHRDIKPSNVMLVDEGKKSERFVILDLGIAKLADFATITNPTIMGTHGEFTGTIAYMSPEQLEGGKVDFRSDIYSFGTTLYQILTGQLPFPPPESYAGLFGFMQKVVNENPPRMSEVTPGQQFSPQLEEVIRDCMAKLAKDRPDSMQTVSQRLLKTLPRDTPTALDDTQILSSDTITLPQEITPGHRLRPIVQTVAAIAVIAAIVWLFLPKNQTSPAPTAQPLAINVVTNPLKFRITAGDSATLNVVITSDVQGFARLHLDGLPGIAWEGHDEGAPLDKQVPVRVEEAESLTIAAVASVRAKPTNQTEFSANVTIEDTAHQQNLTDDFRLTLDVLPPHVWLADDKAFHIDPQAELLPHPQNANAGPGQKIYLARRIERVLPSSGGETRVPFQLIHRGRIPGSDLSPSHWPHGVEPFYLMENKASNRLVLGFNSTNTGAIDDKSWVYQGANAANAPDHGTYQWLLRPEDYPDLPAMNLKVEEADQIARWLTAGRGALPRQAQWDIATGVKDQNVNHVREGWPEGPYRGVWNGPGSLQIALNRTEGSDPPEAVGQSADDVGPYGCRDMAGNGWEYTADVFMEGPNGMETALVPLKTFDAGLSPWTNCRGQKFFRPQIALDAIEPVRYGSAPKYDLNLGVSINVEYPDRGQKVGFRAMIPIE